MPRFVWLSALLLILAPLAVLRTGGVAGGRVDQGLTAAGDERISAALAAAEFQRVVLPLGAVATAPVPTGATIVHGARGGVPLLTHLLALQATYTVATAPAATIAFFRAHVPAGTTITSSGSGAGPGYAMDESVTFSARRLPAGVYAEGVVVDASTTSTGARELSVDSYASWLIPRSVAEEIPRGVGGVAVFGDEGSDAYPAATIVRLRQIDALVAQIDRLQLLQPGFRSCPIDLEPLIDLRFQRVAGTAGPPLARVVETGCGGLTVTIQGHPFPELQEAKPLTGWLWAQHILPQCAPSALRLSAGLPGPDGGADEHALQLRFTDTAGTVCALAGVPAVRSAHGSLRAGRASAVASVAPGHEVTAVLSWRAAPCAGPASTELTVTLPRSAVAFHVRVGSPQHPFHTCGSRVTVSPFSAIP